MNALMKTHTEEPHPDNTAGARILTLRRDDAPKQKKDSRHLLSSPIVAIRDYTRLIDDLASILMLAGFSVSVLVIAAAAINAAAIGWTEASKLMVIGVVIAVISALCKFVFKCITVNIGVELHELRQMMRR